VTEQQSAPTGSAAKAQDQGTDETRQQRGERWREQGRGESSTGERRGLPGARRAGAPPPEPTRAHIGESERGHTQVAEVVVAKIAGLATREVPGVYSMGKTLSRKLGALRARLPGTDEGDTATQGVSVEVGEKETVVDIDIVTWYGQSIVEVTQAVRENVIERVEEMTGLSVIEVNITVDDLHVEGDDEESERRQSRVH
jgi:uncharacterized alkaline shock family protein YloU